MVERGINYQCIAEGVGVSITKPTSIFMSTRQKEEKIQADSLRATYGLYAQAYLGMMHLLAGADVRHIVSQVKSLVKPNEVHLQHAEGFINTTLSLFRAINTEMILRENYVTSINTYKAVAALGMLRILPVVSYAEAHTRQTALIALTQDSIATTMFNRHRDVFDGALNVQGDVHLDNLSYNWEALMQLSEDKITEYFR